MDRRLPVHTISVVARGDHRRSPSYGHQDCCGSDLFLSHSWLSVLMAQRVRNSRAPRPHPPSALSRGWNHPSWWWHPDRFLPRSQGRWLVAPAFGPRGPPLSEPSRRQNSRLGATPVITGRRPHLQYYSRSDIIKETKGDGTAAAAERHHRGVLPHGTSKSPSMDITTKPDGEKSMPPADRVHRHWREYQEHERMSRDILSHQDDSVGGSIDGDPEEAEVGISDEDDASESALPTTIRVPAKAANVDDDCGSVVSDLSLLDDEEEEARDDKNVVPQQHVHEEGFGFRARVPSPGSRPPRTSARKVKISVTGTGQVPAVRPWIVPSSIRHDATWGMTTTEIHDDDVAWPSDEDEGKADIGIHHHHHPRRNRGQSFNTVIATASGAYTKASPATTVSLSSSSFNSSTPGPASHRRDLTPSASTRNKPSPVSSPEIEPSRLFRDFRKSTAATADKTYTPTHRRHGCASAQHCRNRHVLVGGSAVLVHVERRQDRSSSSRVANSTVHRHDRTPPSLRPNTSLTTAVS